MAIDLRNVDIDELAKKHHAIYKGIYRYHPVRKEVIERSKALVAFLLENPIRGKITIDEVDFLAGGQFCITLDDNWGSDLDILVETNSRIIISNGVHHESFEDPGKLHEIRKKFDF